MGDVDKNKVSFAGRGCRNHFISMAWDPYVGVRDEEVSFDNAIDTTDCVL